MKLHASGEDYLETILVLHKKLGMVRSVDVARHMGVSKPSVCVAVNTLKDGGFLTMEEDHLLHLTDVGREVAEKMCIRDRHGIYHPTVKNVEFLSWLIQISSTRKELVFDGFMGTGSTCLLYTSSMDKSLNDKVLILCI